jgi:hypothetical protein
MTLGCRERRTVEFQHSIQLKNIEMKLEELKQCIAIKHVSRQTNVSTWSVSEEAFAESSQEYSEMTPGRITKSRSGCVKPTTRLGQDVCLQEPAELSCMLSAMIVCEKQNR